MFSVGLGLQLVLKLVLNIETLFKSPKKFVSALFRRDTLQLASFLAGSSGIFRVRYSNCYCLILNIMLLLNTYSF